IITIGTALDTVTGNTLSLCLKLNSNGDTIWTKAFKFSGVLDMRPYSVQQTYDSGFIITGEIDYPTSPYTGSFVTKFDIQGNLQWANQYKNSEQSKAYSIKQTPDSGYVITGLIQPSGSYALKLLQNGDVLWAKKYISNSNNTYDVEIVTNGMIFSADNILFKTDFSGNVLWSKIYNSGYGFEWIRPYRIHQTFDGGFIFINSSTANGIYGSKIVKTDSSGNLLWSDDLKIFAMDVVETSDKGLLIIGNCPMNLWKEYGNPIGLIKTDSNGIGVECLIPNNDISTDITVIGSNTSFTTTSGAIFFPIKPIIDILQIDTYEGCVPATGSIQENEFLDLNLSPNPTSGPIHMQIPEQFGFVKSIEIYNSMGQLQTRQSSETRLDISSYATGLYFVIATNDKGETLRAKVVKE
ncbi:MAG: T9SS type A sorting domain-containing protein, partial [Bacteroidota bacterium]